MAEKKSKKVKASGKKSSSKKVSTKSKSGSTFKRPSLISRIEKKNGKGLGKIPKLSKEALNVIEVYAVQPVKIAGQIISLDDNRLVFRHKKKSGSTKVTTSTIPRSEVLSIVGAKGGFGEIVRMQEVLLYQHKDARVQYTESGLLAKTAAGDVIQLQANQGLTFKVTSDE